MMFSDSNLRLTYGSEVRIRITCNIGTRMRIDISDGISDATMSLSKPEFDLMFERK